MIANMTRVAAILRNARELFKDLRLADGLAHLEGALLALDADGACPYCRKPHGCAAIRYLPPDVPGDFIDAVWVCRDCSLQLQQGDADRHKETT